MLVRIYEDFQSFANNDTPVTIEGVKDIRESLVGGWAISSENSTIGLPATVVIDIIEED